VDVEALRYGTDLLAGIVNLGVACFKNRAYTPLLFADDSPVNDRSEEEMDRLPHRSRLRCRIMFSF
jgi:hypothetical protein